MRKTEALLLKLEQNEKIAFKKAAELSGLSLSTWIRERLRRASIKELEEAALPIAFLSPQQQKGK